MLENFHDLFHSALEDPRSTTSLQNAMRPLMKEQALFLKTEISKIKEECSSNNKRISTLEKTVKNMEDENKQLKEENQTLHNTVMQHQKFLEDVDYEMRKSNLIITGLSEDDSLNKADGTPLNTDEEKVNHILEEIGKEDIEIQSINRLGKKENTRYNRVLKVTLKTQQKE